MGILTAASSKSAWCGYEYFMENNVQYEFKRFVRDNID